MHKKLFMAVAIALALTGKLFSLSPEQKPQPVRLEKICVTKLCEGIHQDELIFPSQDRFLVLYDASGQIIALLPYDCDIHTFSEFQDKFGPQFDLSKLGQDSKKRFSKNNGISH